MSVSSLSLVRRSSSIHNRCRARAVFVVVDHAAVGGVGLLLVGEGKPAG